MRRKERLRTPERSRPRTVSITCVVDGQAHDVSDIEMAVATSNGSGRYLAVCGHLVTAAPMVEPDGTPCRLCARS